MKRVGKEKARETVSERPLDRQKEIKGLRGRNTVTEKMRDRQKQTQGGNETDIERLKEKMILITS